MLKVTWSRTVIGGRTAPEDFIAEDENGRTVGRIFRHYSGGWLYALRSAAQRNASMVRGSA